MRNTLLYFFAALVIFPVMAQQQPEWQSQYAVGLNKLAPHTYVVSIRPRACFSPSYNKVKSQTKHVWLLTLL